LRSQCDGNGGSADPSIVRNATYAVTVEPSGGSPSGKPTSAPVFTGKLIETVPQAGRSR
jgi:anti-sigma-K factor RskA